MFPSPIDWLHVVIFRFFIVYWFEVGSKDSKTIGTVLELLQFHQLFLKLMPGSHQTFHLVLDMKLLGIMLRNRWWPTTFFTITTGDADGWCRNCPVWSAPHVPITPKFCRPFSIVKSLGIVLRNRCWPITFHIIIDGGVHRWCQEWPVWSTLGRLHWTDEIVWHSNWCHVSITSVFGTCYIALGVIWYSL